MTKGSKQESPSRGTFLSKAVKIQLSPEEVENAYMARALVQATLPHSNPGPVNIWSRVNGDLRLSIKPDWELDEKTGEERCVGVPYGTIPRLLLFWITTEAVRTKCRRLELGPSLSHFMSQLGFAQTTGGRWGNITRLREHMKRLFRARISFDYVGKHSSTVDVWNDMQVAPKGELWWSATDPTQGTLWQSWIELGDKFYEAITAVPIPVDMRALNALKRSPLALDLYAWTTYRTYTVNKQGAPAFIPWRALMTQLGADYVQVKNFKKKCLPALRKVQVVYPGLNLAFVRGGIEISPGRTAIPVKNPADK